MTTGRTLTVEIYPGPLFVYATLTTATGITFGWIIALVTMFAALIWDSHITWQRTAQ